MQSAAKNMYAIALIQGIEKLTYSELLYKALSFASICASAGVSSGTLVAVDAVRSIDTVVAILGILFAGGVYVPIQFCNKDSVSLLTQHDIRFFISSNSSYMLKSVAQRLNLHKDEQMRQVRILDMSDTEYCLNDPAYVLFTSGTTSSRKGVIVPHRGVIRLVNDQTFIKMSSSERILLHSPLTFDASTLEIWASLLHGGTLILAPEGAISVDDYRALITQYGVTTLWLTAGLFHLVAQHAIETFSSLRQLVVGGDIINPDTFSLVKKLHPNLHLVNGYGPTENTTFTTCYIAPAGFYGNRVPIGKQISGTSIFILDDNGTPVPDGSVGELATGGAGVALGYLGNDVLTRERFIPDHSQQSRSACLYLTGDIVLRREDGNLEFLGRKDSEIKLAGQRVDLEEIERAIRSCVEVAACTVIAVDEAVDKLLVAFVVWKSDEVEAELRTVLKSTLPVAAIPRVIKTVKNLLLTDNGKIDRAGHLRQFRENSCLRSNIKMSNTKEDYHQIFEAVEAIWLTILHRQNVNPESNFFDIGGDSLSLLMMQAELQKIFSGAPSIVELFSLPTINRIVEHLRLVTIAKLTETPESVSLQSIEGSFSAAGGQA